jgi:hypothetical protein
MTLRQFGKAAGGVVIALLINASSLIFFVKWPLIVMTAGGGLAMAFVPFQDRPLEQWVLSFFKAIYSPTIYTWKKKADVNWLGIDFSKKIKSDENEKIEVPIKEPAKVEEFILSLPSVKKEDRAAELENELKTTAEKMSPVKTEIKKEEVKVEAEEKIKEKWRNQKAKVDLKKGKVVATGRAVFGEIPMPDTPEISNVLVGMVVDGQGKIVENAIIEIEDSEGNPSRVLRTNPLGQFKSSTQLANGDYMVITEKNDLKFDVVKVSMKGEIIEPIIVRAKA